jgi:hypothetical protein
LAGLAVEPSFASHARQCSARSLASVAIEVVLELQVVQCCAYVYPCFFLYVKGGVAIGLNAVLMEEQRRTNHLHLSIKLTKRSHERIVSSIAKGTNLHELVCRGQLYGFSQTVSAGEEFVILVVIALRVSVL